MVNINRGHSQSLMDRCVPLYEYAWSVDSIRSLRKTESLEAAIDKTLARMPKDFQIKPFLDEHKAEVKNMLLTEYNEAETMEMFKRDYLAQGKEEGRIEGRNEGIIVGTENERLSNIRSIMASLKVSAQKAMTLLGIPDAEQGRYLGKI